MGVLTVFSNEGVPWNRRTRYSDARREPRRISRRTMQPDRNSIKKATRKRYEWPPPEGTEDVYVPQARNPVHSILTALPVIMLVVGLYLYYQGESEQSHSAPIRAESVEAEGIFTGLSAVKSGSSGGRHYLWFEQDGKSRGIRIQPAQAAVLQPLLRGELLRVRMAPSVPDSRVFWAWYVEQDGVVFLDASESLQ